MYQSQIDQRATELEAADKRMDPHGEIITDGDSLCPDCNGTGRQRCYNPDHELLDIFSDIKCDIGRIGCPACGHDPDHLTRDPCEKCGGTGRINRDVAGIEDVKTKEDR